MGFFDSFKNSFEQENQNIQERQKYSSYQSEKQQEKQHIADLNKQSDSALLNKMKGIFTSDKDKKNIDSILKSRGYKKTSNGNYRRS